MAKVVPALLFLLTACFCYAQRPALDSLKNVLKHYLQDDSVKLNLLNDIAYEYASADPAQGLLTADQAIALANKLHLTAKLAAAYNYKAVNYSAQGNDSMALNFYKQALAIHKHNGNTMRIGTTYNNMAISLVNLSRYPEALEYHTKALAIFESLHDEKRIANSLNNVGVIYLYVSDYDKALEYYFKAAAILEKQEDKNGLKNAYINIGLVYAHLSNAAKALHYQQMAFDISKASGDKSTMAKALGNMGNVYHDMDSSAKALALYAQALAISQELGDKRGIASNYANMGIVYNSTGDYKQALEYIQKSLEINTAIEDKQRMASDFNQLALLYLNAPAAMLATLGIAPVARYNKVIEYEDRSIALAKEIGSVDMQRDAWQTMSGVYEKQNNGIKALGAYKQYIVLRDSVINEDTKLNIARKEMQFDFEKREAVGKAENDKKQAIADAEIHRQQLVRNMVLGGSILLGVAAVITFVFYKKRRDAVEIQKETEFNMQVTDTEMKALRAQMNPHFIFNSLNSISDYVHKYDTVTATEYTAKFAKLMRMILENSEKKEVTVEDDLSALELYMQLEQLRLHNKFTYTVTVDKDIDRHNTFVPPLLLQPFVENSIWHGIAKKKGEGHIGIFIKRQRMMLVCIIEDDGIGKASQLRANEAGGNNRSLGISITKQRIDILNTQKNTNAGVQLTYLDTGTKVELTLPFETDI